MIFLRFLRIPHLGNKPDKEPFDEQTKQNRMHNSLSSRKPPSSHFLPLSKIGNSPCFLEIMFSVAGGRNNMLGWQGLGLGVGGGWGGHQNSRSWSAALDRHHGEGNSEVEIRDVTWVRA